RIRDTPGAQRGAEAAPPDRSPPVHPGVQQTATGGGSSPGPPPAAASRGAGADPCAERLLRVKVCRELAHSGPGRGRLWGAAAASTPQHRARPAPSGTREGGDGRDGAKPRRDPPAAPSAPATTASSRRPWIRERRGSRCRRVCPAVGPQAAVTAVCLNPQAAASLFVGPGLIREVKGGYPQGHPPCWCSREERESFPCSLFCVVSGGLACPLQDTEGSCLPSAGEELRRETVLCSLPAPRCTDVAPGTTTRPPRGEAGPAVLNASRSLHKAAERVTRLFRCCTCALERLVQGKRGVLDAADRADSGLPGYSSSAWQRGLFGVKTCLCFCHFVTFNTLP
ncbi:hypothetical protein DV515_00009047, partial [Chloebia gouldiae]